MLSESWIDSSGLVRGRTQEARKLSETVCAPHNRPTDRPTDGSTDQPTDRGQSPQNKAERRNLTMSRLFLPNRLCATCPPLSGRVSPLWTRGKQRRGALLPQQQQQRRHVGGSDAAPRGYRTRSRIWLCGVGAGVALAVGLKRGADTADGPSEGEAAGAARRGRYGAAVEASRDLLERTKVGAEVGPCPAG